MDTPETSPLMPSKKQQSWGAMLSIVVILLMVVLGAFYAWQRHETEVRALQNLTDVSDTSDTATTTP